MNDIFILKILLYLILINIIGLLFMHIDKIKAKKGFIRIPEKTLFLIAILGGSIGMIIGMYVFRHKTKKTKFKFGIPLIIIMQVIAIVYFIA